MRGPKQRTAGNSRKSTVGIIRHGSLDAPCDLSKPAQAEYVRLVEVLKTRGTLERVDLVCVAECARIKALLDEAHRAVEREGFDWDKAKLVSIMSNQHRGRLRELGLTIKPSNTVFKTNPIGSERDDKPNGWASKLKVS